MRTLRRLTCIWRAEEMPDNSATTSDDRQADELECDEHSTVRRIPELVCIHNVDRKLCVICSRNWAEPQTGQLPHRPKAA
jgi:hypothetical protein